MQLGMSAKCQYVLGASFTPPVRRSSLCQAKTYHLTASAAAQAVAALAPGPMVGQIVYIGEKVCSVSI